MSVMTQNRELLIDQCQGLVRSIALKIQKNLPRHLELDDLISYGQVGLAEAARDFDLARGGQFTTFAYYRIRGAVYDGVSKMSWVSRSQYNRLKYEQLAGDVLRLEHEDHPAPPATLEEGLGWLKNITGALAIVYFSSQAAQGESGDPLEVEDRHTPSPQACAVQHETHACLHRLIDELPEESRQLVCATYFEGLTLTEAGQRLGIGKAWASRLHAKALQRLARGMRLAGAAD